MVRTIVWGDSPGRRNETKGGGGFVKQIRECKRDEQSGESKEEEMMGEGIGEQEMEELVPE